MPNELGSTFDSLYNLQTNEVSFPKDIEDFDSFLSAIEGASTAKTWTRLRAEEELWSVPKVNLLLADTAVVYGGGGTSGSSSIKMMHKADAPQEFTVTEELYQKIKDNKGVHTGFAYYPDEMLKKWVEDASSFISEGRLAYVPERVLFTLGDEKREGKPAWEILSLHQNSPFSNLTPQSSLTADSVDVVSQLTKTDPLDSLREIIAVEVPIIEKFSLADYHKLLNDEHAAVTNLRRGIHDLLDELFKVAEITDDPDTMAAAAIKIRDQTLRPELAQLTDKFKRVTAHRSIRMAGATLGAVGLCASALLIPAVPAFVALLGTGGVGLTVREYSDYLKEKGELRENPFHFLWQLQRRKQA